MNCICAHPRGNHPSDGKCQYQKQVYGSGYFCDCGSYRSLPEPVKVPPLGIYPRSFWVEDRLRELMDTMARYAGAQWPVPQEWLDEYVDHVTYLNRVYNKGTKI